METDIFRLNLISPVYVMPVDGLEPFANPAECFDNNNSCVDRIFCFELNEAERLAFEPDQNKLLGKLIFGGVSGPGELKLQIPGGNYLFAQKKEVLNKDQIADLAVEIQMEALWQRLEPGEKLYLRYLFEDNSWVTQLYRPWI